MNTSTTPADPYMEDLYEQCSKIVHHITMHPQSTIEWKDLEILVKTALMNSDKQKTPKEEEQVYPFRSQMERNKYSNFITDLQLPHIFSPSIMKAPPSTYNAVILDNIIQNINKSLELKIDMRNLSQHDTHEDPNRERQRVYLIIKKMFLLPLAAMDIALDRILKTIDFNTLGYIFCEPSSSMYFEKCVILEDMICSKMRMPAKISDITFMNSIFKNVSSSRKSQHLYRQCLKNKVFRDSIFVFFKAALKHLKSRNIEMRMDRNCFDDCLEPDMLYTFSLSLRCYKSEDVKDLLPTNIDDLISYIDLLYL